MLPRILGFLTVLTHLLPTSTSAQSASFGDYDTSEWAQSMYDQQPSVRCELDPDDNSIACDQLPRGSFAPYWWTDTIPATAVEA